MGGSGDSLFLSVKELIDGRKLIPPNGGVVVGLSGGPDSACLLHILARYLGMPAGERGFGAPGSESHYGTPAGERSFRAPGGESHYGTPAGERNNERPMSERLVAVHVNHMLRGGESLRDEEHAAALCARSGVRIVRVREDVAAAAAEGKTSVEAAGREARYRALEGERRAREAQTGRIWRVAVAHNRDDLAETVMMNILRGAGPDGLQGMSAGAGYGEGGERMEAGGGAPGNATGCDGGRGWNPAPTESCVRDGAGGGAPGWRSGVIRPLIGATRAQIEEYLAYHSVKAVYDSSNADEKYMRNKIRHSLLPLLRAEYNPALTDALCRLSESAGEDAGYLASEAAKAYNGCLIEAPDQQPGECKTTMRRGSQGEYIPPEDIITPYGGSGCETPSVSMSIERFGETPSVSMSIERFGETPSVSMSIERFGVTPSVSLSIDRFSETPSVSLSIDRFSVLHEAISARVARLAYVAIGADVRSLARSHISAIRRLSTCGRTGAVLQLPGGVRVLRTYSELRFTSADVNREGSTRSSADNGGIQSAGVNREGSTRGPACAKSVETSGAAGAPGGPSGFVIKRLQKKDADIVEQIKYLRYNSSVQLFDADVAGADDPVLRFRRAGDYFHPLKSPGRKKLKDYFIDIKIPGDKRGSVPLLAVGSEIVWVIGYRISERYKVTERTENVLEVRYINR